MAKLSRAKRIARKKSGTSHRDRANQTNSVVSLASDQILLRILGDFQLADIQVGASDFQLLGFRYGELPESYPRLLLNPNAGPPEYLEIDEVASGPDHANRWVIAAPTQNFGYLDPAADPVKVLTAVQNGGAGE